MTSVLYDAQGPRAKQRNIVYTVLFLLVAAAVVWWVYDGLAAKHQLDWIKWKPFFTSSQPWQTYIWPGLQNTLKAAAFALVIALPLGALFGIEQALGPPVGADAVAWSWSSSAPSRC